MRSHKVIIFLAGAILLTILLLMINFQSIRTSSLQGAADIELSTPTDKKVKSGEEIPAETVIKEVEKTEPEANDKPITEEIKDTVTGVVESAIGLFVREDLNIVAIGDSLTKGVGDSTNNGGYVGIIKNTLEDNNESVEITNYGKPGNRTDQLLERLDKPEISASIGAADIILVTIGANDIMKVAKNNFTNLEYEPFETEQKNYEKRLRSIFETMIAKNSDAQIFLIGFYNPFEKYFGDIEQLNLIVNNWNATASHVALDYKQVYYIPVEDLFQNAEANLFAEDNFHPNKRGYLLMAKRVLEHIRPTIVQEDLTDRIGEDTNGETATEQ